MNVCDQHPRSHSPHPHLSPLRGSLTGQTSSPSTPSASRWHHISSRLTFVVLTKVPNIFPNIPFSQPSLSLVSRPCQSKKIPGKCQHSAVDISRSSNSSTTAWSHDQRMLVGGKSREADSSYSQLIAARAEVERGIQATENVIRSQENNRINIGWG